MRLRFLVVSLVLLAGCARPGTAPLSGSSTAVPDSASWTTYAIDVTGVESTADPLVLTLDVSATAGRDGCSQNLRTDHYSEVNGTVHIDVLEDSRLEQVFGACPTMTPGKVALRTPTPVGDKILVTNQVAWRVQDGRWQRCNTAFACESPPPDHCDDRWVRLAVSGLDVSRHSQGSVESCDATWLVMTVPDDPALCGAGGRPGCDATTTTRRYFMRFQGTAGWVEAAVTQTAGCVAIKAVAADFPTDRCANLKKP